MGAFLFICYACSGSGTFRGDKAAAVSRVEGDFSCTLEVRRAILVHKKAYGDSLRKVLYIEEETKAWGLEPYDIEDVNGTYKNLIQKGIVLVQIHFLLLVLSNALDYLSPNYLNKTSRILKERAKLPELSKFGRPGHYHVYNYNFFLYFVTIIR
ncbi:hypothetical protein UlMin_020734 [Ulmus minor]